MPPHSRIATLYDRFAHDDYLTAARDAQRFPPPLVIPTLFARHRIDEPRLNVLDLACGPGNLRDYTRFARYTGVDLSPTMLQLAGEAGYSELIESPLELFLSTQAERSTDVVVCTSALYFIPEETIDRVLADIARVARVAWLVTFDGIPADLIADYAQRYQIPLANYLGRSVPGTSERLTVPGWPSPLTQEPIPMEFVFGLVSA